MQQGIHTVILYNYASWEITADKSEDYSWHMIDVLWLPYPTSLNSSFLFCYMPMNMVSCMVNLFDCHLPCWLYKNKQNSTNNSFITSDAC